ncbi:hypothetical protein ACWGJA_25405, partial [Streptomyces sp. NPDC054784]
AVGGAAGAGTAGAGTAGAGTAADPGGVTVDRDRRLVSAPVRDRMAALTATVRALDAAGIRAEDIALRRPTLDEVFLHLTGDTTRNARTTDTTGMPEATTEGAAV